MVDRFAADRSAWPPWRPTPLQLAAMRRSLAAGATLGQIARQHGTCAGEVDIASWALFGRTLEEAAAELQARAGRLTRRRAAEAERPVRDAGLRGFLRLVFGGAS